MNEGDDVSKAARFMLFAAWGVFFAVLITFFYYYEKAQEESPVVMHAGEVIISANRQGHYTLDGSINDVSVKMILDTGATLIAVPDSVAKKAGLEGLYPIVMHTANGNVTGQLTRIKTLKFAKFTLENVKAVIMPAGNDNQVLLGMNALSQFSMEQSGGKLTLRAVTP